MPRKIHPFWRAEVLALRAEGLAPREIEAELDRTSEHPDGVGQPPRERTIQTMRPTDEEEAIDRFVRWPESMGTLQYSCGMTTAEEGTKKPWKLSWPTTSRMS